MSKAKTIAVLGAGNVGHAMAGHLVLKGYEVRLFNRWEKELEGIRTAGGIHVQGHVEGFAPLQPTTDIEAAVSGADLVVITAPAFAHDYFSDAIAPFLSAGQIVFFQPGHFGSSIHLRTRLAQTGGPDISVAECVSSVYSCRVVEPGRVNIRTIKNLVRLAAAPADRTPEVVAAINTVFDDHYAPAGNVLEIGLAQNDAVYHVAPTLLSMRTVENAEDVPFFSLVTPGVARVIDAIDAERVAIAESLGLKIATFREFLDASYGIDGPDLVENVALAYGKGRPSRAPKDLTHRFVTEGIPYGLVPWAAFARQLGVPTPVMDSLITLGTAMVGPTLLDGTDGLLERLGVAGKTRAEILDLVGGIASVDRAA